MNQRYRRLTADNGPGNQEARHQALLVKATAELLGMQDIGTGGGCTAYWLGTAHGGEILATECCDPLTPTRFPLDVGATDAEGNSMAFETVDNAAAFVAFVNKWRYI